MIFRYLLFFEFKKKFSWIKIELLDFKPILPSLEYFTSVLRVLSGSLISPVDKPTDFYEVTNITRAI